MLRNQKNLAFWPIKETRMLRWSIATVSMGGTLEAKLAAVARAGFRAVAVREERLEHAHDPRAYLRFLEEYAERETFETLDAEQRVHQIVAVSW